MTFVLAHLSDPHVPPLPVPRRRELVGKRMLGYLNWTRNRYTRHSRAMLDALVADMQAQRPDHIAVTGDLLNLSLKAEYPQARKWIEAVGPPDRVTVIPGNHDAYVRGAKERFDATFADYIAGDTQGGVAYPFLRRRDRIVLIATSTAVPTPPLMATGWLGRAQRAALDATLEALASEPSLFRVVLIHHPLRSRVRHKRLTDSRKLLAILRRHGADLVLHGHDHVHSTIRVMGPHGDIPVVGVPSASATTGHRRPPAAYNLFAIARDGETWRVTMTTRGFDESGVLKELARTELIGP